MKKLMLISLFLLTACGTKNNDPTTPPPPTVPHRQPAPAPKTGNTGRPATGNPGSTAGTTTGTSTPAPTVPVTPAPLLPVVPVSPAISPKVLANVIWDCHNSVTGKSMQLNGYMTDLGQKYFIRPNGQQPVEVETGGTDFDIYSTRYCAKAGSIPDLAAWAFEIKGSVSGARQGTTMHAVLTRYRNVSSIDCNRLKGLADYDLREAYNCTMGPTAFVNPEDTSAAAVEVVNLGEAKYDGKGQKITNVKRDALGNVTLLINNSTLIRLDKKLALDTSFGDGGKLKVELPRETFGDEVSKILDFAPDNSGGVMILARLRRSDDIVAVHLSAKGGLLKNILVNGYTTLKAGAGAEYRGDEEESSLVLDGQSVFAFYRQYIFLARNGSVVTLNDRLASPIRPVNMSAAAGGGVFVTWWDESRTVFVTKFKSDGSANTPVSPTPNLKIDTYYYGLEGTVPHPDGGFFLVYKTIERGYYYGSEIIKFDRISANGIRLADESYSVVNPSDGYGDFVDYNLAVKNTVVFANGLLGLPVRWGARISNTKQGGVVIADPAKKNSGKSYRSSVGMQDLGFDGNSMPWIVVKDDGSIHTLALYIDREYTNRTYHLILTKVSP